MIDADAEAGRESLLLRGTLDMCVLALLRTPTHAYGVVEQLQAAGFKQTSYGSVYPLVSRVRKQGLVSQETIPSEAGPARNVLSLTPAGRTSLANWEAQWRSHQERVSHLMAASPAVTHTNDARKAHV
jgi:PadR family transcriptional regulator, regulatory protein PadR